MSKADSKRSEKSARKSESAKNSLSNRLIQVADLLGSRAHVAKMIGLSESQLYKQLKGTSSPRLTTAAKLAKEAGVSLEWLVFGEGPKFLTDAPHQNTFAAKVFLFNHDNDAQTPQSQEAVLNLIFGEVNDLTRGGGSDPPLALLKQHGDTMSPTIKNEDMVLLRRGANYKADGIYAVRINDAPTVRRLQFAGDGIRVLCDNSMYKEQWIPSRESEPLQILGKVIWYGRFL